MNFYTNVALSKGKVLLRGYENGQKIKKEIPYSPYLFLPSKKQTEYKTIYGNYVDRIDFANVWDAKKWINEYKDVTGFSYSGMDKWQYVYIHDNYPKEMQYDVNLIRGLIFDIEVDTSTGYPDIQSANKVITAIAIGYKKQRIVLSYKDYVAKEKNVKYIKCYDENDLLFRFLDIWEKIDPDYVSGWNIQFFDIPYIISRTSQVLGEEHAKRLSPWGQLLPREVFMYGRDQTVYTPVGVAVLDYQDLYKKFTYNQRDSYSLNNISYIELGEKKVDYSEFSSLHELYEKDFEKFIDYNLHDVELIFRLDDKMKLFELVFAMAYDAKVNYTDTMTTVLYWDVLIYNYLANKNIIVPKYERRLDRPFEGGYVKEVIPKMYKWVVSFDLTSLYPHLIIQNNIGPETFVRKLPNIDVDRCLEKELPTDSYLKNDYVLTANGCLYTKQKQSFLSELMEVQFAQRVVAKNKMIEAKKLKQLATTEAEKTSIDNDIAKYNNIQMAKKIQLNSAYGAIANIGFRYFNVDNAEAITLSGQLAIRWVAKYLNVYLNKVLKTDNIDYVIAIDTDSVYLNLEAIVNENNSEDQNCYYLDRWCETNIQPVINFAYQSLATKMNVYKNAMKMKREAIGNRAIWTAKKRYMISVLDNEGVRFETPDLKTMGIETVRSSTPEICRKKITEAIEIIMTKDVSELRNFIDKFKKEYKKLLFQDIAFPRGVQGITKYQDQTGLYKLGTPIHTRASILYNKIIKDRKMNKQPIFDGDKIKFVYLKLPNTLHEDVIASPDVIPEDLAKFIDYEKMFEKSFLDPITNILNAIGWELEPKSTLGDLF